MIPLYTVAQIRGMEETYVRERRNLRVLMYQAGVALADRAEEMCPDRPIAVLCGRGNNGGDGFVAAYHLFTRGVPTVTFGGADGENPLYFENEYKTAGGKALPLEDFPSFRGYGLIIDALFGTGLNRAPEGLYAEVIARANAAGVPVLSADIPSGIGAEGIAYEPHINAEETLTFLRHKPGEFTEDTCRAFGRTECRVLDMQDEYVPEASVFAFEEEDAKKEIPLREPLTHKGNYPRVALFVGAEGYSGAAILSVRAALRSGAGLVFAGVPERIYGIVAAACPEAVVFPLKDRDGALCEASLPEALRRAEGADGVLCGCGLSRTEGARAFLLGLTERCKSPLVLDADGINGLSGHIDVLKKAESIPILTPHRGELARLMGESPLRPGESPVSAAARMAKTLGVILVMKGHRTLTAHPDGRVLINTTGNPGMARGGSGDVLAGMVTVISAKKRTPESVAAAVYFHGRAGDMAARTLGQTAMLPGDMIEFLPEAFYRR